MKKRPLNEYQAAIRVGMSPPLLKWLTSYKTKMNDPRKLKLAQRKGERLFYEEDELVDYDMWLRQPWPHKPGKRPPLPDGIKREVRVEANGECAICNTNANSCEAAHVEPVHTSKSNHPHNLIWLCSNHHTKYDNGAYGPDDQNKDFVRHFKRVLHRFKRTLWENQVECSKKLFDTIDVCENLQQQLASAKSKGQIEAIKRVANEALDRIPKLAPMSKVDKAYSAYAKLATKLDTLPATRDSEKSTVGKLAVVVGFKEEFRLAAGLITCPLCKGNGQFHDYDCPVCGGSGAIDAKDEIDLSPYEHIHCPLCQGEGTRDSNDCPECQGNGTMERRFADQVDLREYKSVDCPLCNGEGTLQGNECPECEGNGRMERRFAEQVDLGDYKSVDCPLCEGEGTHERTECPECEGNGKMDRRSANRVELGNYKTVECPLCKGEGARAGEECPVCEGNGRMERRFAEQVDLGEFKFVDCPKCGGSGAYRGNACAACSGEGKMERRFADRVDFC